jgi:DNA-binding NtrC family response regulator
MVIILVDDEARMLRAVERLVKKMHPTIECKTFERPEDVLTEIQQRGSEQFVILSDGDMGSPIRGPQLLHDARMILGDRFIAGCLFSATERDLLAVKKDGFETIEKPGGTDELKMFFGSVIKR